MIFRFETGFQVATGKPNPTQFDLLKAMQKGFQDASTAHAEVIGYGTSIMDQFGVFWAIARLRVKIIEPLVDQTLYRIQTWPNPHDAVGIDRNYLVFDASGRCVVMGMGKWVIVDKVDFRLVKPNTFKPTAEMVNPLTDKVFSEGYRRFQKDSSFPAEKIHRDVSDDEIDQNNHVNNVVYLDYLSQAFGQTSGHERIMTEYQLNYSESLFKGDRFTMDITEHLGELHIIASRQRDDTENRVFQAIIEIKKDW